MLQLPVIFFIGIINRRREVDELCLLRTVDRPSILRTLGGILCVNIFHILILHMFPSFGLFMHIEAFAAMCIHSLKCDVCGYLGLKGFVTTSYILSTPSRCIFAVSLPTDLAMSMKALVRQLGELLAAAPIELWWEFYILYSTVFSHITRIWPLLHCHIHCQIQMMRASGVPLKRCKNNTYASATRKTTFRKVYLQC